MNHDPLMHEPAVALSPQGMSDHQVVLLTSGMTSALISVETTGLLHAGAMGAGMGLLLAFLWVTFAGLIRDVRARRQ